MDEIIDNKESFKEKRGKIIPVLAVLSWIYIGITAIGLILNVFHGPLTQEELNNEKAQVLAQYSEEMLEKIGYIVEDSIYIMQVSNDNFWPITFFQIVATALGFISVLWMYQLKKNGYYGYIIYSALPILLIFIFYQGTFLITWGTVFHIIIGGIFCLLYGIQSKRMN